MVYIHTKKYKETSRRTIEEIKKQQHIHRKDLIQPRREGELNIEFVRQHGIKNLNISQHDIYRLSKKDPRLAEAVARKAEEQQKEKANANQDK